MRCAAYFIAACLTAVPQIAPAVAQDYPNRPMTVIGTTPGGTSVDLTTRFFGERIKEKTGQPWVIENKPGAQGADCRQGRRERQARRLHDVYLHQRRAVREPVSA